MKSPLHTPFAFLFSTFRGGEDTKNKNLDFSLKSGSKF